MNSRKNLLLASAIFSLLTAIVSIILIVVIVGFESFTPYTVYQFLYENGVYVAIEEIQSLFQTIFVMNLISVLVNLFIIIVSFNLAFVKNAKNEKPVILLIAVVLSWLFSSVITSILLTISYFITSKEKVIETNNVTLKNDANTQIVKPTTEEFVKEKIEKIRALYQINAITKEEYDNLVKELFANLNL